MNPLYRIFRRIAVAVTGLGTAAVAVLATPAGQAAFSAIPGASKYATSIALAGLLAAHVVNHQDIKTQTTDSSSRSSAP